MRNAPILLANMFVLLLLAPPLKAQTGLAAQVVSITGRDSTQYELEDSPIGKSDCDNSPEVTIDFVRVPTDKSVIDVWRGEVGEDCSDESNRDATDGDTRCDPITLSADVNINGQSDKSITFSLNELVSDKCDTGGDGKYEIHFLATNTSQSDQPVGATEKDSLVLTLDTEPPSAPSSVSDGSGDSAIKISWSAVTGDDIREYHAYVTTNGCGSDGGTPSFADEPYKTGIESTSNSVTLDGGDDQFMLDYGESIGVAIKAVDQALNESDFSAVACATRVRTDGFCTLQNAAQEGTCDNSCSTRAPGFPGHKTGLLIAGLFALLLGAGVKMSLRIRQR